MIKLNYIALCLLLVTSMVLNAQPIDIKPQAIDDARSLSIEDYPGIEKFHNALRLQLQGKTDEAEKLFLECLESQPNNDAIHFALGNIALNKKLLNKAKSYYEKAYALDKSNKYYIEALAKLHLEFGEFNYAETLWQELVKDQPRNVDFQYFLGQCFIYNRKYSEALETFNTVENLMGVIPQISTIKIQLLDELNKKETINEELKKLRYADPYNPETQSFILGYFQKENALIPFYKRLEVELTAEYPNPSTFIYLLQNPNLTDSIYRLCLRKGMSQNIFPQITLAQNLNRIQTTQTVSSDSVEEIATQLLANNPGSSNIINAVEQYLEKNATFTNTIQLAKQKIESDPNVISSWKNLIYKELKLGLYSEMLTSSEEALEYFPLMPQLYYLHAQALLFNGKIEEAKESFDLGKSYNILDNEESTMLQEITSAHFSLTKGKTEQIQKTYIQYSKNASFHDYINDIGLSFNLIYKTNLETELTSFNSSYFKAQVYFDKGEYSEAKKILEKLLAVYPKHANAHDLLGDVFYKLSLPKKAIDEWSLAKKYGTNNSNIEKKIETKTLHESKYY